MKPRKIANIYNTKISWNNTGHTLPWRTHINMIIPKLSSACFAIRAARPFLPQESMKIYYSYFHSIMMYGIIFLGNSYCSINTFILQKNTITIIMGIRNCNPNIYIYIYFHFLFCNLQHILLSSKFQDTWHQY